ncbi:hypothetical protein GNF80_12050 [Clostridium perfringens]|nr:hypothetical protein [Clostridium perfringens]
MKMKKYLALVLSVLAITVMVGCSSNDTSKENGQDINSSKDNISQDESKQNKNSEETTYLGKVKKIVGNEIEMELAKDQDVSANDSNLPEGVQFQESIEAPSDGGGIDADSFVDNGEGNFQGSINMAPADGSGSISFSDSDMGDEKLELEYTDETIEITIPTGANIFDMRSGSDSKLSAIKTNSIIKVFAKGTKEAPIVQSIDIVE